MRLFFPLAGVILLGAAAASLEAAGELSNRRAPGFSLPDSNINYHDLGDYRGKIVLVDGKGHEATVTISDVRQSNGVIHVIDSVLLPS